MLDIKFEGIILDKTGQRFENNSVLNPTCLQKDGITHMFYRAVREGNFSSIGYCQIDKTQVIKRADKPVLVPEYDFERHGCEDPRIVQVEDIYYLFYVAYDGKNARAALATSSDLVNFEKQGLVSPSIRYSEVRELYLTEALPEKYRWYARHYEEVIAPDVLLWEKELALFPEKFNGKFLLFHRVMPGIQYLNFTEVKELKSENFWREQLAQLPSHIVKNPEFWYETRKIGASCTPIKTQQGWLLVYHGVEDTPDGNVYHASAALLDLKDPTRVIGRLSSPLFSPYKEWEKMGVAKNVVFASGAAVYGDELYIYYGAADTYIAAASVNLSELLKELIKNKI